MSAITRYAMVDCGFDDYQLMPDEGGAWVDGDDHDKMVAGLAAALRFVAENSHEIVSRDVARRALAKAGAA